MKPTRGPVIGSVVIEMMSIMFRREESEWKFLRDHQKIFQSDLFPPNLNVLTRNQIWFWVTKRLVGKRGVHTRTLYKRGKF